MKILLIGKNGQVGWELQRALAPLGELICVARDSAPPLAADLGDPQAMADLVERVRPQAVVNAAAHTAVDKAESEVELARTINALAPGAIAQAAARVGAVLVHYSTDYVFDGSGTQPWQEGNTTGPLSVYGRTKLEGEALIRDAGGPHLIFRTSWVYGTRGGNFAKTMLRLAAERERLTVVNDQVGAPTGADLIADVTAHALRSLVARPELAGTYHLAASGETSWHGYATHVIESARRAGQAIRVQPQAIEPVPSSAFATAARRPLNSRLDTRRLQQAFGLHLPNWRHGVDRMLAELLG